MEQHHVTQIMFQLVHSKLSNAMTVLVLSTSKCATGILTVKMEATKTHKCVLYPLVEASKLSVQEEIAAQDLLFVDLQTNRVPVLTTCRFVVVSLF